MRSGLSLSTFALRQFLALIIDGRFSVGNANDTYAASLSRCYPRSMTFILKWFLSAAALLVVAYLYSGVVVTSFTAALIAAAVLGILNTIVKPLLVLLTLPVTIITLGLFIFVINALMFWAAASLLDGLRVNSFVAALIGSLIYSALQLAIEFVLGRLISD